MIPNHTSNNHPYEGSRNAKIPRNNGSSLAHSRTGTDDPNSLRSQFGMGVPLPASRASFRYHVASIIDIRPEPQVIGIDAPSIVATWAVMADAHTVGDRPTHKLPCNPMRSVVSTVAPDSPVAMGIDQADPQPARFGALNVHPKPSLQRQKPSFCSTRPAAKAAIAFEQFTAINPHACAAVLTGSQSRGTLTRHRSYSYGVAAGAVSAAPGPSIPCSNYTIRPPRTPEV